MNPLSEFVAAVSAQVRAEIDRVTQYDFAAADVPEPLAERPSKRHRNRIEWRPPDETATPETAAPLLSLAAAREEMLATMVAYTQRRVVEPGHHPILLVRAAPGIGKTHAAVLTAQGFEGRVLFAMPTHAHYSQLQSIPVFDRESWYHWLGTDAPVPDPFRPGETMCREAEVTRHVMAGGWPLRLACNSICQMWSASCDYRAQRHRPEPIVAGVHEHITFGLDSPPFELAIIDEEPMRAMLRPRRIPGRDIHVGPYAGPVTELHQTIKRLCDSGGTYRGRILLDILGPVLSDVYGQIDDPTTLLPAAPDVSTREELAALPAWFLPDLLILAAGEYEAWKRRLPTWLERVVIHDSHLYLYKRADLWAELPDRCIIIDATADPDVYRQMFPRRRIKVYEPFTRPAGKLYQVVGSYLGIEQVNEQAEELAAVVQTMSIEKGYRQPGIVTFQKAVPVFASIFGEDAVAHFGGQRGSNALADRDAGFVVGTFSPPDGAVQDIVKILNPDRVEGFQSEILPSGVQLPLRTQKYVSYRFQNLAGQVPWRKISGLWSDSDLEAIMRSRREAEIIQAVHRFRIQTRDVPVWLLSPIPTGMRLDGLYDDPPVGPPEIPWRTWVKLLPWLEEQAAVTNESLAVAAGLSPKYVANKRWLDAIARHWPDKWEIDRLVKRSGNWQKIIHQHPSIDVDSL